jgi:acyl-CoA synthetase (AMP-forming)/AMP-acid ligase II
VLPASGAVHSRPLPGAEVKIADDGEILIRGPHIFGGYYKMEDKSFGAIEDGWLHTGDLGRIDEEGFLYVEDRLGDVIVSGGESVLPTEVEEVLLRHPEVADAAAVGRADAEWQEAVTAVVVLHHGASVSADELREHCAAGLAGFKVPRSVDFEDELPRHPTGKLYKRLLRDPYWALHAADEQGYGDVRWIAPYSWSVVTISWPTWSKTSRASGSASASTARCNRPPSTATTTNR